MTIKHINIKIFGRVQGVFFRSSAINEAEKLNIKGFARNEDDGTVYFEAEGNREALDKFLRWGHEGPNLAQIEKVETEEGPLKNFSEFEVI